MNRVVGHFRESCAHQRAGACLLALLVALASPSYADPTEQSPVAAPAPSSDIFLYAGWKVFHSNCHGCHGTDALGTDVAPNLVERIDNMTPEQFATKVLTRYRIVVSAHEAAADDGGALREAILREVREHERGQAGALIMPAWEFDDEVKPHVVDIYDYLVARADGRLGPGEPPH